MDKLRIWFLSFTPYFNLVSNLSIVSIWSLNFQCHVNLVSTVIFQMEIAEVINGQNKKLVYYHINIDSFFFFFAVSHVSNFHSKTKLTYNTERLWTKLTQCQKVVDQIDIIERLRTRLKYDVKNRDQICSLPIINQSRFN